MDGTVYLGMSNKKKLEDVDDLLRQDKTVVVGDVGYVQGPAYSAIEVIEPKDILAETEEDRKREELINRDKLVKSITNKESTVVVIDNLLVELAREIAFLKIERGEVQKSGKPTIIHTTTRINALRQLCDSLFRKQENVRNERLDLKSPRFKAVLKVWMDFVYESMEKADIKEEQIDMVFKIMKADMIDWEKKINDI